MPEVSPREDMSGLSLKYVAGLEKKIKTNASLRAINRGNKI